MADLRGALKWLRGLLERLPRQPRNRALERLRVARLDGAILRDAVYDDRTQWPRGVHPVSLGAVPWVPDEIAPAREPAGRGDEAASG